VLWVEYPPLTLVPAILFALAYVQLRRRGERSLGLGVAALVWIAYALYELGIYAFSPRAALIRIDLIVLGPLMYAVAALGIVSWWRARSRRERDLTRRK
jgi:nitroreductase